MMAADVNLQVWLDTVPGTRPSVMIPYVKSHEAGVIQYQLHATRKGAGGTSSINQSGDVRVQAGHPTALTQFSMSLGAQDQCKIELTLFANGHETGTYQFDCPRPR
ncbi:curli-like amyloid fiber formation chaperone CsgH [Castellaniella caeni]|uniref:curli-like amyloid fiber formation chaperone CsgH n=1 Tax=Castellaniella caeni TaxID=266123 RepID=UPI000C9EEE90|nr:curli-like amyloid fiber formation chaperone CsgH [Castellaniella caeni]